MIELQMQSEKKNMRANKDIFLEYIQAGIDMPPVGEGKTSFTTVIKVTPIFADLTRQHPDFTSVLAYLVKYKVLMANRPNFEGDMPMTRGDVLKVYFKGVMGVNMDAAAESCGYPVQYACLFATQQVMVAGRSVPMSQIVTDLGIDISAYAASSTLWRFDLLMKLYLA